MLALALFVVADPYPLERFERSSATSLRILAADGEPLWQSARAGGGRGHWVAPADVSPHLIAALLASEDHRFYAHAGVDPLGIARAAWLNLAAGRAAFGGSTVTMQLARLLDPSIGRDFTGKLRQAVTALRLERAVDKHTILEHYVNRIYFGNGAWGAQAAARRYFGKDASELSLAEASLLAVLPRSPGRYNPLLHRERALQRRAHILGTMRERGDIDAAQLRLASGVALRLVGARDRHQAPHFVDHVLNSLDVDPAVVAAGAVPGGQVHTALDRALQQRLQLAVRRHLDAVGGRDVRQAGVVVLRHSDGAILAMVGSRDYHDAAADGALNVTTIARRPGSTLKPFVYALALEAGDSPATLAYDVVLPGEATRSYAADVKQHGFARYRESLAGSYNLAAVHTVQRVGVRSLVQRLRAAGVRSLANQAERGQDFGPGLAIGEAHFTILDYAGAFAAFATGGRAVRPRAVVATAAPGGPVVPVVPAGEAGGGEAVFSPQVAYQIFDILSDDDARRPMFGRQAPMTLPFRVALKTGTTRAYTDNLAFGTTAQYTVGAWAGNFDGSPTQAMMAMQGAAPLVRAAFVALAARFGDPTAPPRPDGLIEEAICPLSGKRPGPDCPHRKLELFTAQSRLHPDDRCGFHVRRCGRPSVRFPDEVHNWARAQGLVEQAPCDGPGRRATGAADRALSIVYPHQGAHFQLDPFRPAAHQMPPLRALPGGSHTAWHVDGKPVAAFVPSPGPHTIEARRGRQVDKVDVRFE